MTDYFIGQYDYIYFFYGLSFLFMALVCFSIDRKKSATLPWFLMGFFGLVHGMHEWIDLVAVTYGERPEFTVVRPVVLGLSYMFLFEFALVGFVRIEHKVLARRWVYAPLIAMVVVCVRAADNGASVGVRYFLGFPASLLASFVVFKATNLERKEKQPLYAVSIILLLYAVMTGLMVSPANIFAAGWLNVDSFYRVCRIPAPLVRGVLALCLSIAVWFYSSVLSDISFAPHKLRLNFKLTKWGIFITITALIGLGWVFTNFYDRYATIQIIKSSKERANSPLNYLIKQLSIMEKAAVSLSRSSTVRNTVFLDRDRDRTAALFESFLHRFDAKSISLVKPDGEVLLSTGDIIPEKIKDRLVIRPSYFKDALSGGTGFNFSLRSQLNERVYFVSCPVVDRKGMVGAVIVMTKTIPVEPLFHHRFFSILITFLVCVLTITFFLILRKRESLIGYIDVANAQLQEIDRLKTDFISIVSHELRTPLTAINNAASILLKGKLKTGGGDPRERELLEIIMKNTSRQTRMVSDLLDVSKIEAGVMPVFIESYDIVDLVNDAAGALQSEADAKGIVIEVAAGVSECMVSVDPDHTRRIVTNLLSNAVKYTPAGGKITIRIREDERETIVSISDTGPGIPQEQQGKLFTKFYRASDAKANERTGTGLGLMITKGLVEAQKGRVWVASEVGRGSTFSFSVPKAKS